MIPVILSGGSGTRLWPISRKSFPKQFCDFFEKSFMNETLSRVSELGEPLVLTVESMRVLTQKVLHDLKLNDKNSIYEPFGRNTAPAIALLTYVLKQRGMGSEVVGVFPADHLINDKPKFIEAIRLAEKVAKSNQIVTLGIKPEYAATGFGYIETQPDNVVDTMDSLSAFMVNGFREKPNASLAEEFLNSGMHFWNAGMFVFKVDKMIEVFETHQLKMWQTIHNVKDDFSNLNEVYNQLEPISIDYAIMEQEKGQVCIPVSIGWSDVGSWEELSKIQSKYNKNLDSNAEVHEVKSNRNFVYTSGKKHVGLIGIEDTIIVDTDDALLITKKTDSQLVKDIVEKVKASEEKVANDHTFDYRPWGRYDILDDRDSFKAKVISVNPGQKLSYQSHKNRDENWVVVEGNAEVTLNDEIIKLSAGEHVFIPRGAKHRIKNPAKDPLVFVEVQTGSYFGEDDIVRYEDDYNRV